MKKLLALLVLLAAPAFAQIDIGSGGAVNLSTSGGGGIPYPSTGITCSTGSGWCSAYSAGNQIPASYLNLSGYIPLSGTFLASPMTGAINATNAAAQATEANLTTAAGGANLCPGVVNDACPNMGGTNSHMICTGNGSAQVCTCTSGTGPTDQYFALQTCASTPGHWLLPGANQGSQGWAYTSQTVWQNANGNWLDGQQGKVIAGGNPTSDSTVIETQSSMNIPALGMVCDTTHGMSWTANGWVLLYEQMLPSTPNSYTYYAVNAGYMGPTEPTWPTGAGATVTETLSSGQVAAGLIPVVWKENTSSETAANSSCINIGHSNMDLEAVTSSGGVDTTTGSSASGFIIPALANPSTYTGYNWFMWNSQVGGYGAGGNPSISIYGASRGSIDNVGVYLLNLTTTGPGMQLYGPGIESTVSNRFRTVVGQGGSLNLACGLQVGGSSHDSLIGVYLDNMDTSGGAPACLGNPAGTGAATGWFRIGEFESQLIPMPINNNSHWIVQMAGDASSQLTNGSIWKVGTTAGLTVMQSSATFSFANLASETITAGTPVASTSSGTLPANTYYYELAGGNYAGQVTFHSNEVTCTIGSAGNCSIPITYASTVNGYQCIWLYRGTTSGSEQLLPVPTCNLTTQNAVDNGSLGVPSGAPPATATYYHPFIDLGHNSQGQIIGPVQYIQAQDAAGSHPQNAASWLISDPNHQPYYGYQGCTVVPYGTTFTPNSSMAGECIYTPGTVGHRDSLYNMLKQSDESVKASPDLNNTTGTGAIALNTSPTFNGLTDTGTTALTVANIATETVTNATCTGTCTGFSTSLSPQSSFVNPYAYGGIGVGKYTSGITTVGTTGQTCILTFANTGSSGPGTATIALTSTNSIAGGTAYVVTNAGSVTTTSYTTATVTAGTATSCSGPATVTNNLQYSVQGTGSNQNVYVITVPPLLAGQCIAYTAEWERTGAYTGGFTATWTMSTMTTLTPLNINTNASTNLAYSTIHVCNQAGTTAAQWVTSDAAIIANSSGYPYGSLAALDFTTSHTLTFVLNYPSTDYYYPLGYRISYGN